MMNPQVGDVVDIQDPSYRARLVVAEVRDMYVDAQMYTQKYDGSGIQQRHTTILNWAPRLKYTSSRRVKGRKVRYIAVEDMPEDFDPWKLEDL
jgi:hypothetical protein